jgi:dTDP-4-amino-4,6-dideoxygalactose transaminase
MIDPTNIYTTRPFLPPLDEFLPYLQQIWANQVLTNSGPFHVRFEAALEAYLGVRNVSLFANGTIALSTALQAMGVEGEVITTPYSFVATTHCLLWNGLEPVFVDIDPVSLNISPDRIEAAITPRTSAILGVHCYGTPCDVTAIKAIADRHGLRVVYDAAHAFGVRYDGESLLNHGDFSTLSMHATKVFNTFEGGAIIAPDEAAKTRIDSLKNFGKVGELDVASLGTNGKMSEFNAALGLLQLDYVDEAIMRRGGIDAAYRDRLAGVKGIELLAVDPRSTPTFTYFPIFVTDDYPLSRDQLDRRLKEHKIISRPYFYPLISAFPMYRDTPSANPAHLPVATRVAEQVLCLPIYPELALEDVDRICRLIAQ